jgi:hypothetical protein
VNSVLFLDGSRRIHEVSLVPGPGASWTTSDLTHETGAPVCDGRPKSYTRADGTNSIVFDSLGGFHEIIHKKGWSTNPLGSPLQPYIDFYRYLRSDGVNAIVGWGPDEHVWELYQRGPELPWADGDITVNAGEPVW